MFSHDELSSLVTMPFSERIACLLPTVIAFYNDSVRPVMLRAVSVLQARHLNPHIQPSATWDVRQYLQFPLHEFVLPSVGELMDLSYAIGGTALGLCLLLTLFCTWTLRSRSVGTQDLYEPLNALMTIVAPTTSLWSSKYIRLARKGTRSRQQTLFLSLHDLQADYICGSLELRHCAKLPDLMRGTLQNDGWRIRLHARASWRIRVFMHIATAYLGRFVPRAQPNLYIHANSLRMDLRDTSDDDASVNNASTKTSSSQTWLMRSPATGGRVTFILDAVPYSRLHAYIRAFQKALPPGTPVLLGFSTLGPPVSLFGAGLSIAAVPFLPRKYVRLQRSHRDTKPYPSTSRTTTPLLTSVESILKTLTSGSSPLIVESVQNVSDQYADCLHQYAQDLADNAGVRARFIGRWSIEGWREERLLAIWEEGLCRSGLLTRWMICAHS